MPVLKIHNSITLTHLPLVPHICESVNQVSIGTDNGLSPIWRQAIIWTNAGLLSIGPLGTKLFIHKNAPENIVCEVAAIFSRGRWVNRWRQWQYGQHFADSIFKCIFLNENFCVLIQISLAFVPKDPIDYKSALVQVLAWHQTGDKPLPEPMVQFTGAYICLQPSACYNHGVTLILCNPIAI